MDNMENVDNVENEVVTKEAPLPGSASQEEIRAYYSPLRYGWGAFCAFFGFSTKTHRASKKRAKLVLDIATYIILLLGTFIMIYPFWWMLAGSFADTLGSGSTDLFYQMVWWPSKSTTQGQSGDLFYNYSQVLANCFEPPASGIPEGYSYWRAVLNNLIYSIVPVVVGVITSASAAFAFSKIEWYGRNFVFFFLLAAVMVPGPSVMITQYVMYDTMGWRQNGLALIIPGLFGSIMTAFFIRQFLFGLPTSIVEAAKIDGAGYFRIFCQFILPLAMPAIMAQGLLSFMGCWNNYMGSYIMIDDQTAWINLPHAMYIVQNQLGENQGPVIAASVLCVLPVMILFACFQKLIINSLMLTGSKE